MISSSCDDSLDFNQFLTVSIATLADSFLGNLNWPVEMQQKAIL